MAKQVINIGTVANDGTGDPIRTAFTKTNDNFTELYDPRPIVLPEGTTVAGTAPLKFTEQASPLTVVEAGTMEYVEHSLQFSQFLKRRGVVMSQDVRITTTTLENTAVESDVLATAQHGADYFRVGKSEETVLRGLITQRNNASAFITIKVIYAGVEIHTVTTVPNKAIPVNTPFSLTIIATCRSIGVTGTLQINSFFEVGGESATGGSTLATVNTTIAEDTTVKAQWNEANVNNIFIVQQSRTLCIEPNY